MNREEIIADLKALLGTQPKLKLDLNAITEGTRLDQMGFDSISILDFMYEVESRFNTRIEVADLVRMEVVRDLIDHLHGKAVR